LTDAVVRAAESDAVFSLRLAGFVLDALAATDVPSIDPELDASTAREREMLPLIARGYAYEEIARELFISMKTVETHVSSVLRKLHLLNRHELRLGDRPPLGAARGVICGSPRYCSSMASGGVESQSRSPI
jgi:DNA-binding NarL/FixJ family response regulator